MKGNKYSESSSDTETESGGEEEEEEESEEQDDDGEEIVLPPTNNKPQPKSKEPRNLEQIMMDCEAPKIKTEPKDPPSGKEVGKPVKTVGKKQPSRSSLLTGRGVTTQMLIEEQILEAGEKCLTINYLGKKFTGDLISNGTIKCNNAKQVFSSPSAWAMHCKKQVNPDKKSGCGWASVKYKGRKLDEFKSIWFRKQKIAQAVAASSENDSSPGNFNERHKFKIENTADGYNEDFGRHDILKDYIELKSPPNKFSSRGRIKSPPVKSPPPNPGIKTEGYVPPTSNYLTFSEALQAVQRGQPLTTLSKMNDRSSTPKQLMPSQYARRPVKPNRMEYHSSPVYHTPQMKPPPRKKATRTRISVKHSLVQPNSDLTTLVECAQFQSTGKIQPFSITISTSTLLLIDFHCHLTMTEVSGYLAGKWDVSRQHLRASQAYPCKYDHTSSEQEKQAIENEIRYDIECKGMMLLGWYHSHPFCQPDPSLNDIQSQLEFQEALKDGHYEPCVGLIVSPYDSYKKESQINAFWVRGPSEGNPNQVGLPLSVRFTTHQDQTLTQDVVNEMVALVNYYCATSEVVTFSEAWSMDSTYMDKLKHSVIRKFPLNQTDGRFLDFIHKMLMGICG